MKSLHDFKGEYRAARKRYYRKGGPDCWHTRDHRGQALVNAYLGQKVTFANPWEVNMLADIIASGGELVVT